MPTTPIGDLLRAGDLGGAAEVARNLLAEDPAHAEAQHLLGLHALSRGVVDEACDWFEAAVGNAPQSAWYWCNLGHARMQQARLRHQHPLTSVEASRRAVQLRADYPQARYNLACALLECDQRDEAASLLKDLCEGFPGNADYACALGDVQRLAGNWRAALRRYRRALECDPGHVRAESNLGALLAAFGEGEKALLHCRRAVEKAPDSWNARRLLGRCLVLLEDFDEAMQAFADAYERHADSSGLCVDIARVWQENGDLPEAASWFQRALGLQPGDASAHAGLAAILLDQGQAGRALSLLGRLLDSAADNVEVLKVHALCLWHEGDASAAIAQLRKAQSVQPQNAALYAISGQILASAGEVESAHAEYLQALALNTACIPALSGLATSQRGELDDDRLLGMMRLLDKPRLRDSARAALHGGLAQVFDSRKDWPIAASHMAKANALQWAQREKRGQAYAAQGHAAHCRKICTLFDRDWFDRTAMLGSRSEVPVFIVGMPRSGTTLTEQILARHPQVLGIGERNFAAQSLHALLAAHGSVAASAAESDPLDRLDALDADNVERITRHYLEKLERLKRSLRKGDAQRVVDKMPDNYSLIGWIATLFPAARIIHCRRDPRDVALSCWLTQFGKIQWASRWPDLLDRINHYQALMRHWRAVLPGRFIESDYETMVADQEGQSRRLVEWLGLDWDPRCLQHYAGENLVRTASITQVRQPIYQRSVARWQAYLPFIPELADICIESCTSASA